MFKETYPLIKIGKTKFFHLKPQECKTLNAKGIHNICVCKYHQNFKLMTHSLENILLSRFHGKKWQDYLELAVCSDPNSDCYIGTCQNCPDIDEVVSRIKLMIDNYDDEYTISYQAWQSVDRAEIATVTTPILPFIEELSFQLLQLKRHDFIGKAQHQHLNNLKQNLAPGEVIVLMDFAQNYNHSVQDSIQSQYFSAKQTTIHPVVFYYNNNGSIDHKSLVFISDSLTHDTLFVYAVQKKLIPVLKATVPQLKKVHYFTDGAASQYKNKKIFLNLLFHKKDFQLEAVHNHHVTSHGKAAIDGIGGTAKRIVYRESMRSTNGSNPIQNADDFFNCIRQNNTIITPFFITVQELDSLQEFLCERWKMARTIKGTQGYHYFAPSTNDHHSICCKAYSDSEKEFNFKLLPDSDSEDD